MFSCEFYKISNNTFFTEHLRTTAPSEMKKQQHSKQNDLTKKDVQRCPKRNRAGIETCIQSWRFLLHTANNLRFTLRIKANHSNSILVHFVGWLFHALKTFANQWPPSYHINVICSNVLPLDSLFFQDHPLDTLWGRLHDTLIPYSRRLKQNKPICEEHLYSGHYFEVPMVSAIERFHCNCFQFFCTPTLT